MTVVLLSFATASYAQKAGDLKATVQDTIPGSTEAAGVRDLIEKGMYNSLVDPVNRRKLLPQGISANRSRFDTLLTSKIKSTAFSAMNDPAKDEFLYYVKNNFGTNRVNKVIKNFSMAGDSAAMQKYIGTKLRGFYSVNGLESFRIPSFIAK